MAAARQQTLDGKRSEVGVHTSAEGQAASPKKSTRTKSRSKKSRPKPKPSKSPAPKDKADKKEETKPEKSAGPGLPKKLSSAQIAAGIRKRKPGATCGKHGGGKQVRVKLEIVGATGQVRSASAMAPHAKSAAGKCVMRVVRGAKFPKFTNPSVTVVYPVKI
jgi:hypothetical protein